MSRAFYNSHSLVLPNVVFHKPISYRLLDSCCNHSFFFPSYGTIARHLMMACDLWRHLCPSRLEWLIMPRWYHPIIFILHHFTSLQHHIAMLHELLHQRWSEKYTVFNRREVDFETINSCCSGLLLTAKQLPLNFHTGMKASFVESSMTLHVTSSWLDVSVGISVVEWVLHTP